MGYLMTEDEIQKEALWHLRWHYLEHTEPDIEDDEAFAEWKKEVESLISEAPHDPVTHELLEGLRVKVCK